MAQVNRGYDFRDLSDAQQVPTAAAANLPDRLFFPIARVFPRVELERISLGDLTEYLNTALPMNGQLQDVRNRLPDIESNLTHLLQLTRSMNSQLTGLTARVVALEAQRTPTFEAAGSLTYGIIDNSGTKHGTAATAAYTRIPSTVSLQFPSTTETGQHWYVEYPAGVMVSHIYNDALQRRDETAQWSYDAANRRYTSVAITPHFTGNYSIAVV